MTNSSFSHMKIALIGGQYAPHYTIGLMSGLLNAGLRVDVITDADMRAHSVFEHPHVNYLDFKGEEKKGASFLYKILRILRYYYNLIKYTLTSETEIFHIQWFDRLHYLEKIFFVPFYRFCNKKTVLTAHNINAAQRDDNDSQLNRLLLKFCYHRVDQLIVHTQKMKEQLVGEYEVPQNNITVIPHGIMSMVPISDLSRLDARKQLGIQMDKKVILFFGHIKPYKGLDSIIDALPEIKENIKEIFVLVAGGINERSHYWSQINDKINSYGVKNEILYNISYIPDEDIEMYFKSADLLVLPYKNIFQSGVLFLGLHFGIPMVATDVGSFNEYIIEEKTGFLCEPENPKDLARAVCRYFESKLYAGKDEKRAEIKAFFASKYSWIQIGKSTASLYSALINPNPF